MPRIARVDAAGIAHHVMARGIERRKIFLGEEDRRDFVTRLERLLPEEGWRSFAWALMPNHVHLVLQGATGGLSRLMARLNTGYARSFNRRHGRAGYLFQNRFKSRAIEKDGELRHIVIYTHRNPLVAGLVASAAELERFPWCGHGSLVGSAPPRRFEAIHACLSLFSDDAVVARRRVRALTAGSGLARDGESIASLVAPPAFAAADLERRAQGAGDPAPPGQRRSGPDARRDLEQLIAAVSGYFGIPQRELRSPWGSRQAAQARAIAIHMAVDALGLQGRIVAEMLNLTPAAVSHALRRGRAATRESTRSELLVQLRSNREEQSTFKNVPGTR